MAERTCMHELTYFGGKLCQRRQPAASISVVNAHMLDKVKTAISDEQDSMANRHAERRHATILVDSVMLYVT